MIRDNFFETPKQAVGISKNAIYIIAALVSFSLWLASTISVPKRLENIEERLRGAERSYAAIDAKVSTAAQDVRDIKRILMGAGK